MTSSEDGYRAVIARALLLLASVTLLILVFNKYVRPVFPSDAEAAVNVWFAAVVAGAAFLAWFNNIAALVSRGSETRRRRFLQDKFGRGPYDKATIDNSTRYYIRPKCTSIDPGQEIELRHSLIAPRQDLFDTIDLFLDHGNSRRHLLLLADSGTGKTSFVLNYYAYNQGRPKKKRHRIALVPLGIKGSDALIARVSEAEDTVLFLDAFDEDVKAIRDHKGRITDIMESCQRFKRVVITCRTQFFPRDEEIPAETGILKLGPRKAGEKGAYEFWKLYLSPFDDDDVRNYIKKRFPFWRYRSRKKARSIALKIPLLSARPMLLAYIPDIMASNTQTKRTCELYEVLIEAWLERESSWADKAALREFSERLAVDLYVNRGKRHTERIPHNELSQFAKKWKLSLKQWQLTGRSLLNRDAEGNYKFAHRSIMEYLFVLRLVKGDTVCFRIPLTDQMKRFLLDLLLPDELQSEIALLSGCLESIDLVAYGIDDTSLFSELAGSIPPFQRVFLDLVTSIKEDFHFSTHLAVRNAEFRVRLTMEKGARKTLQAIRDRHPEIGRLSLPRIIEQLGVQNLLLLGRINETPNLRVLPTSESIEDFVLEFVILNKQTEVAAEAGPRVNSLLCV
jgi:hypothetical protein